MNVGYYPIKENEIKEVMKMIMVFFLSVRYFI